MDITCFDDRKQEKNGRLFGHFFFPSKCFFLGIRPPVVSFNQMIRC